MNTGSPPTPRNARTGEFTPPGIYCWARLYSFFELVMFALFVSCLSEVGMLDQSIAGRNYMYNFRHDQTISVRLYKNQSKNMAAIANHAYSYYFASISHNVAQSHGSPWPKTARRRKDERICHCSVGEDKSHFCLVLGVQITEMNSLAVKIILHCKLLIFLQIALVQFPNAKFQAVKKGGQIRRHFFVYQETVNFTDKISQIFLFLH